MWVQMPLCATAVLALGRATITGLPWYLAVAEPPSGTSSSAMIALAVERLVLLVSSVVADDETSGDGEPVSGKLVALAGAGSDVLRLSAGLDPPQAASAAAPSPTPLAPSTARREASGFGITTEDTRWGLAGFRRAPWPSGTATR